MSDMRELQDWMMLDQEQIDELTEQDWNHYKGGGCLCFAHCDCECVCGSWIKKGGEQYVRVI